VATRPVCKQKEKKHVWNEKKNKANMKKQRQEVNVVSKTSAKYEGTKLCMYISQYSSAYEHVSMVYSGISYRL